MAFTLVGWSEEQDTGGNLTYVAALADPHVRIEGDNVVVPPDLPNLMAAYALGTTISQAQIESPALRRLANVDLTPLQGNTVGDGGARLTDYAHSPLPLDPSEPLRALVAETAAGAEREWVLAWLCDGPVSPVAGEIFTVRAVAAVTLTANVWTNCPLTFAQALPAGRYAVVGMAAHSATCIAARLVFTGYSWRPGVVGANTAVGTHRTVFRGGRYGVFGEFDHNVPPTVDFLASAADTAETVFLDLMKVG